MYGLAHAVDDLVEARGHTAVLDDPAVEGKRRCVEEAPRAAIVLELLEAWLLPLAHHVGDAGDVECH